MDEDPEMLEISRHTYWSEEYVHEQHHDVNVVRTEDCIFNQFILVVNRHEVDCMTIYLNIAIFAKLDIKRDDLDDKTLKASSKKMLVLLFTKYLTLTPVTIEQDCKNLLDGHHRLAHVSNKRAQSLNIDDIKQPTSKIPKIKCPVCIASKATRHMKPAASTAETRTTHFTWQDIYSDLSGKMRTPSITSYHYLAVFVCAWSGAKHCEFIAATITL